MDVHRGKATCPRSHRYWGWVPGPEHKLFYPNPPLLNTHMHISSCWLPFLLGSPTGSLTVLPLGTPVCPMATSPDTHRCFQLFITLQKEFWLLQARGCGTSSQEVSGGSQYHLGKLEKSEFGLKLYDIQDSY